MAKYSWIFRDNPIVAKHLFVGDAPPQRVIRRGAHLYQSRVGNIAVALTPLVDLHLADILKIGGLECR